MSGNQISQEYLVACLDVTRGLLEELKSVACDDIDDDDDDDDEPSRGEIRARGFGDTCDPPFFHLQPSDNPKGEGCWHGIDLASMLVLPDPTAALDAALALVTLAQRAIRSAPRGQMYHVSR